jgi:hypothetical protein
MFTIRKMEFTFTAILAGGKCSMDKISITIYNRLIKVDQRKPLIILVWMFFTFALMPSVNAYEFPPYQGVTLKILGNISEDYSNNITFASNDQNKVQDFRTMLNLGLDFKYEGHRRSIDFSGRASRQIFRGSSNVLNPSESMSLTFNNEFSEYDSIMLRGTFDHTQEPGMNLNGFDLNACRDYYRNTGKSASEIELQCNLFKDQFNRFKGSFDSYNDNFNFVYNRSFTESFNISTNYSYGENWSTAKGTNDSKQNTVGVTFNYKYVEDTDFFMSYVYQISSYVEGDDISRQSYNVGIGQYLTKRLYFNGSLGMDKVSSGNNSISVEAMLRSEVDEKTTASLSYSRGTEISSFQGDTFKNWQITTNVARYLSEDFQSSLSAFYGKGDYSSSNITDTFTGAGFNLSYNFWESQRGANIRGNLGYSYSKLDSTDITRGYTRNSVTSGLTLAF